MSSLCPSLHFSPKEMIEKKEKKYRNISACRIAMIMKFSTHSRHYIYLL